ncbi:MAG: glycosyltransferase family 4 protein, partial [Pararhodobacter sp.]
PNIHFAAQMPNAEVRALLGRSHFSLLPTLADTFGFSMIEAMAEHTPVIATSVAAVPEVVDDGFNGYLLPLETTPRGDWRHHDYDQRHTAAYARRFRETTEALAEGVVARLEQVIGQPAQLRTLRRQARLTAERMFSAAQQGALWDDLYERVAREPLTEPAAAGPEDVSSPGNIRELVRDMVA